jgi:hypothetical protein
VVERPCPRCGAGDRHQQPGSLPPYSAIYIYISPLILSPTPGVFYTYSYNHARLPRLEKLLYTALYRAF